MLKNKIYLSNLFLIDWDDTLFPTTWIKKNNINFNNSFTYSTYKLYFLELDKTISAFLKSLEETGDIYIVTNAKITWIKSCLTILHETSNLIIKHNIRIISARDLYSTHNYSSTEWKILTFQNIIGNILTKIQKKIKPNTFINIISIGDAMYEYIALINLDNYIQIIINDWKSNSSDLSNINQFNYLLKNIKFLDKPDFNYIIDQIQELHKNKDHIINKLTFIDYKYEIN